MIKKTSANANAQRAFRQRQRDLGRVYLHERIPAEQADLFRAVAAALRDGRAVTIHHQKTEEENQQ